MEMSILLDVLYVVGTCLSTPVDLPTDNANILDSCRGKILVDGEDTE